MPPAVTGSYEIEDACNTELQFQATNKFLVRCDMETDGGKWLVIQRRINGSNVNFRRNWTEYVNGFGDLEGEFWYGLEKIHCLTTREDVELRIELGNDTEPSLIWTYQTFKVGGAATKYRLTIEGGKGIGGTFDTMSHHNGSPFTTYDRDNDAYRTNCAATSGGAWWHNRCANANLNSIPAHFSIYNGTHYVKYKNIQMKIRPKRCTSTCK